MGISHRRWQWTLALSLIVSSMVGCNSSGGGLADGGGLDGGGGEAGYGGSAAAVERAEALLVALPPGEEIGAHPLIHGDSIYVMSEDSEGQSHLRGWRTGALEPTLDVEVGVASEGTPNLMAVGDWIPLYTEFDGVVTMGGYTGEIEALQGVLRVNARSGEIAAFGCADDGVCGDFISGLSGVQREDHVMPFGAVPIGAIYEVGELLYFSSTGMALHGCSGEVRWFGAPATLGFAASVVGGIAHLVDTTGQQIRGVKLSEMPAYSQALIPREEILAYEVTLEEPNPGMGAAQILAPLVYDGVIYVARMRTLSGLEGIDFSDPSWMEGGEPPSAPEWIVELLSFDAASGEARSVLTLARFSEGIDLLPTVGLSYHPVVADGVLYLRVRGPHPAPTPEAYLIAPIDWKGQVIAVDLKADEILWRREVGPGRAWPLPTAAHVVVVEHTVKPTTDPGAPEGLDAGAAFTTDATHVLILNRETGAVERRLEIPALAGTHPAREKAPLINGGDLYLPISGLNGGEGLAQIALGDDVSGAIRQWRVNNQGNPVIAYQAPTGETQEPRSPAAVEPAEAPAEVDEPAGDEIVHEDITPISALYVALLKRARFSSNGEDGDDIGEGMIKSRVVSSCVKEAERYPLAGRLPLPPGGAEFEINLPLFAERWETLTQSNAHLMFGYFAYEHDEEGWVDVLINAVSFTLKLAQALINADACGLIEALLEYGGEMIDGPHEFYGTAYLTVTSGNDGTNTFGIATGERAQRFEVQGAEDRDSVAHTTSQAADVADLVCALGQVLANPTSFMGWANVAGSLLSAGDIDGRHTEGEIMLRRAETLPLSAVTVHLDGVELSWSPMEVGLSWRAGLIGDELHPTTTPEGARSPGALPLSGYAVGARDGLDAFPADLPLYELQLEESQIAALFVEVDLRGLRDPLEGFVSIGVVSRTWFFDEAIYGAWRREGQTLSKAVTLPFSTPYGAGAVRLTLTATLR